MKIKNLLPALLLMLISFSASTRSQAQQAYVKFDKASGTETYYYGTETTNYDWDEADVKRIVIDKSYSNYNLGSSLSYMFKNYVNLTSIEGLGNINTANVTNMQEMFAGCTSLKSIDLTGFNTSKVQYMAGMFSNCSSLKTLDLSGFNTENVTDMFRMFGECSNLQTIYVSKAWTVSKIDNPTYQEVFSGCKNLFGQNATCNGEDKIGADYANTTNGYLTLKTAQAVVFVQKPNNWVYTGRPYKLNISTNFGTVVCKIGKNGQYTTTQPTFTDAGTYTVYYKVEDGDGFIGVSEQSINITVAKIQGKIMNKPTVVNNLKYTGKEQELVVAGTAQNKGTVVYSLDGKTYSADLPKAINAGSYTVYYKVNEETNISASTPATITNKIAKAQNTITATPNSTIYDGKTKTLLSMATATYGKVTFTMGGKNYTEIPTAVNAGTYKITCQVAATTNYNAASTEVTVVISKALNEITKKPSAIKNLVANDNPQELISAGTVKNGTLLYSLDGKNYSSKIPTAVDAGEYTVYYKADESDNYKAIDAATLKVTVAEKEAPKPVKEAYALLSEGTLTFYYGENKPEGALPLRNEEADNNWPSSTYTTITKVVFDKSFKEYKPYKTSYWFQGFDKLTEVSGMENINTEDLEYMNSMFQFCDNLKSVDFSGFNTAKVTDMTRVFWGCENLESVFVGEGWTTSAVKKSSGMFEDCFKLYGGKGTAYNKEKTDASYAVIDGGKDTPGYFTKSGEPAFKKTIVSIEISTLPKTEYTEGDDFSAENGVLTVNFNTGEKETADLSKATITGYDKTKVGEQTLKITFQGFETELKVTVKAKPQDNNDDNNDDNNTPTPVHDIADYKNVKVWSYNSVIFIESVFDCQYRIIDLNGRIIKTSTTKSTREEINNLKSGIYIVLINNKSYKVAIR
ncbi:MAG: BspA family leucine-rich repeat surface protein [Bacteroidales bacterium]|nr:BspA family leucine-rich repeat surface protein [Bacteroidales bacterium]